jgi:hypothetical protein
MTTPNTAENEQPDDEQQEQDDSENGDTVAPLEEQPKKFLTAGDIRKVNDLITEDVYVEEWGGWLKIKALTSKERDRFENSFVVKRGTKRDYDPQDMRAKLVVLTAINPDYSMMFQPDAWKWLGGKNAAPVNKCYNVASRLCGISEKDEGELEDKNRK